MLGSLGRSFSSHEVGLLKQVEDVSSGSLEAVSCHITTDRLSRPFLSIDKIEFAPGRLSRDRVLVSEIPGALIRQADAFMSGAQLV